MRPGLKEAGQTAKTSLTQSKRGYPTPLACPARPPTWARAPAHAYIMHQAFPEPSAEPPLRQSSDKWPTDCHKAAAFKPRRTQSRTRAQARRGGFRINRILRHQQHIPQPSPLNSLAPQGLATEATSDLTGFMVFLWGGRVLSKITSGAEAKSFGKEGVRAGLVGPLSGPLNHPEIGPMCYGSRRPPADKRPRRRIDATSSQSCSI